MKTAAGDRFRLACLAISVLLIGACARSYSSQLFAFPSEVKPHESGWTYLGTVTIWDKSGVAPLEPVNKKMSVVIRDVDGEKLLDETFEVLPVDTLDELERNIYWVLEAHAIHQSKLTADLQCSQCCTPLNNL